MTEISSSKLACPICAYSTSSPRDGDLGAVRGNTERFKHQTFQLWKCPKCLSLISLEPVDMADIYRDYPLNNRKLDALSRSTYANLLERLKSAGVKPTDKILDYGCGNGIFVEFLKERGYQKVFGYDPYVHEWSKKPTERGGGKTIIALYRLCPLYFHRL